MAGRRRRPRPLHCLRCGGQAAWDGDTGYLCGSWDEEACEYVDGCGAWYEEGEAPPVDDGRIRGPEDVGPRLLGALESAKRDGRLSDVDRAIHAVCCQRASDMRYVEIMAGSEWLAEEAARLLGRPIDKSRARRSRQRLENLGYLRRLKVSELTSYSLKAQVETRKAESKRPVTLLEVRKAPVWPTCDRCSAPIPDIQRVSKRYCSDKCRKADGRTDPRVEAKLDEVFAELRAVAA